MNNRYLLATTVVSSAAIAIIGATGQRMLAPFYGTTIFLSSIMLVVIIVAVSLGLFLGSRTSSHENNMSRIPVLLVLAGMWIVLTPLLRKPLLMFVERMDIHAAVVIGAAILFAPATTALGVVISRIISTRAASSEETNKEVVTTIAYALLSFLVGFLVATTILIPNIQLSFITIACGLVLIVTAFIGGRIGPKHFTVLTIAVLFAGISWHASGETIDPSRGFRWHQQSRYSDIRVLDTNLGRMMLVDGAVRAVSDTMGWQSDMPDVAVMNIPKYFLAKPGRVLIIGIGGAALVKNYFYDGWVVDVTETDPEMISVATDYFGLRQKEASVLTTDARQYLTASAMKYDVVIIDATAGAIVTPNMLTQEMFSLVGSHLTGDSYVAVNVSSVGWNGKIVKSVAATLNRTFLHVLALPIAEPPNLPGNVVLLASNSPLELFREIERDFTDPDYRWSPSYEKNHAWDNHFVPDMRNARILTDDTNPADLWLEKYNYRYRISLHETSKSTPYMW